MRPILRRSLLASALTAFATVTSCEKGSLFTAPQRPAPVLLAGTREPERACARLTIALHGNILDQVTLTPATPACGTALGIVLAGPSQLDRSRNVVRVPIALQNDGTTSLGAPARIYGWEDSLLVTSPSGLASNKHTAGYVGFVGADSAIAVSAASYPGALVWRFDSLLAAPDQPPRLVAGARSSAHWIEIAVKQGVHGLTATLWADAAPPSVPAAPIYVLADTTLTGPVLRDTVAFVGDRVVYSFTPKAGFTNAQVRIDGLPVAARGTLVADTLPHVVTASADRVVTVAPGAEDVYAAAQAVLTAGDVPAAYQAYIDAQYAYVHSQPDMSAALRHLAEVNYLVFDPVMRRADLERTDAILNGWSFRVGPDGLGAPVGTPIFSPSDTMIEAGSVRRGTKQGGLQMQASARRALGDTLEATTFQFVNGIWNDPHDANAAMMALEQLIRTVPDFSSPQGLERISTRLTYNHTRAFQKDPALQRQADCMAYFTAAASAGVLGTNSMAEFMVSCTQEERFKGASDIDLAECMRQVQSIRNDTDEMEADAVRLARDVQRLQLTGRQVVIVSHSQGTLMTNQALNWMSHHPSGAPDSISIAVIALAAPVSERWAVRNDNFLRHIVIEHDPVPRLGFNSWPVTSTARSRRVGAVIEPLFARGTVESTALAYAIRLVWGAQYLHPVIENYMSNEARPILLKQLEEMYGAVTVHTLVGGGGNVTLGNRFNPSLPVTTNLFGDFLARGNTYDTLSVADSSIVAPVGGGIYLAKALGQTTLTGTRVGRTATTTITVVPPIPALIAGKWAGTWQDQTDPANTGPITFDVSGSVEGGGEADVTFSNDANHNAYTGGMSGFIIREINGRALVGNMGYQRIGGFVVFVRFVSITASGDTASGIATDGSGVNTWHITLHRVLP